MDMPHPAATPVQVPLGTRPLGVWDSFRTGRRNLLELIPEIATRQPMISGRTVKRWHMVMDPGANRRILKDRVEDYPKSDVTKMILGPAIGDSLFIAEGAHWHWQRRAAAPAFSVRNVQALAPVMTIAAERAAERVTAQIGRAANLFDEMVTTTFDVISDVTFSGGEAFDRSAVHRAIDAYIAGSARVSLLDIIGAPAWVPRPSRMVNAPAMRAMKAMADAAIEHRRGAGPRDVPDLLDLLLDGEDPETKRRMNTAELRDNLLTFIVAGHETTALTLAWALYLSAFDPAVQDRARAEAKAALGTRAATVADLAALPYCRQIVDEALRLYPPAAFLSRTATGPRHALRARGPARRHGDAADLRAAPEPRALARSAPLRSRPLRRSEGGGPLRLPALRRRAAHLHRRLLRAAGGGDHPRHPARPVPLHAGSGARSETRADPDPAPRRRGLAECRRKLRSSRDFSP